MSKFIILIIIFSGIALISGNLSEPDYTKQIYNNSIYEIQASSETFYPIFSKEPISQNVYEKMLGNSIPTKYKDKVDTSTLSYLKISYIGFDGTSNIGEMVVNTCLADEVLDIFMELYEIKYPIEKIKLIDEYEANDELSMSDNNTSCFCYRAVSGTTYLSNHSLGAAIDINPLYNPYVANGKVSPACSYIYADRNSNKAYQINKNDALYKIFINKGWTWGGDWNGKKDYQHFEKKI